MRLLLYHNLGLGGGPNFRWQYSCQKRETYQKQLKTEEQNGKSLVFVDECGFPAEAFRPYAYALSGEPICDLVCSQKHRTTSMIAARIEGVFTAHTLFEGSCNAQRFNTWLEQELCPLLRADHLVIMDNARFHKLRELKNS